MCAWRCQRGHGTVRQIFRPFRGDDRMLFNQPRAVRIMNDEGVAALVATAAENVTYTTGYWSMGQWSRPGPQVYTVLPADRSLRAALVCSTGALDHLADDRDAWVAE